MFRKELEKLRGQKLLRQINDRASSQGRILKMNNREFINFASNDYLGLASDLRLIRAAKEVLETYGTGAGASRLLGGGTELHEKFEKNAARFKRTEAALLFNSGYAANIGAIPVLAGERDAIFSDELNHASLIDGCRLSKAQTFIYGHADMEHLETLLKKGIKGKKIIITDTVFSMDGDIALIPELAMLCRKHDALLYLDDAHATGVLGNGQGSLRHFGMEPEPWIVQMFTLGKALGSQGAAIAASSDIIEWLINRARSFIYSTTLPAHAIAAAQEAIHIVEHDRTGLNRLWENRDYLVDKLQRSGFDTGRTQTPIIPVLTETVEKALEISRYLLECNIYAPAIRPPTVAESRLRLSVTAAHRESDLEKLITALTETVI